MKKGIHPDYHPVVFRDPSANFAILTRSTIRSDKTIEWSDGKVYPVVDVDVSSASHPFYTGRSRVMDTAGRVERFRQRYAGRRGQADTEGQAGTQDQENAEGRAGAEETTTPEPEGPAEG